MAIYTRNQGSSNSQNIESSPKKEEQVNSESNLLPSISLGTTIVKAMTEVSEMITDFGTDRVDFLSKDDSNLRDVTPKSDKPIKVEIVKDNREKNNSQEHKLPEHNKVYGTKANSEQKPSDNIKQLPAPRDSSKLIPHTKKTNSFLIRQKDEAELSSKNSLVRSIQNSSEDKEARENELSKKLDYISRQRNDVLLNQRSVQSSEEDNEKERITYPQYDSIKSPVTDSLDTLKTQKEDSVAHIETQLDDITSKLDYISKQREDAESAKDSIEDIQNKGAANKTDESVVQNKEKKEQNKPDFVSKQKTEFKSNKESLDYLLENKNKNSSEEQLDYLLNTKDNKEPVPVRVVNKENSSKKRKKENNSGEKWEKIKSFVTKTISQPLSHISSGLKKKSLWDMIKTLAPVVLIRQLLPIITDKIIEFTKNTNMYWQIGSVWFKQLFTGSNSIFKQAGMWIKNLLNDLSMKMSQSDNSVISSLGKMLFKGSGGEINISNPKIDVSKLSKHQKDTFEKIEKELGFQIFDENGNINTEKLGNNIDSPYQLMSALRYRALYDVTDKSNDYIENRGSLFTYEDRDSVDEEGGFLTRLGLYEGLGQSIDSKYKYSALKDKIDLIRSKNVSNGDINLATSILSDTLKKINTNDYDHNDTTMEKMKSSFDKGQLNSMLETVRKHIASSQGIEIENVDDKLVYDTLANAFIKQRELNDYNEMMKDSNKQYSVTLKSDKDTLMIDPLAGPQIIGDEVYEAYDYESEKKEAKKKDFEEKVALQEKAFSTNEYTETQLDSVRAGKYGEAARQGLIEAESKSDIKIKQENPTLNTIQKSAQEANANNASAMQNLLDSVFTKGFGSNVITSIYGPPMPAQATSVSTPNY